MAHFLTSHCIPVSHGIQVGKCWFKLMFVQYCYVNHSQNVLLKSDVSINIVNKINACTLSTGLPVYDLRTSLQVFSDAIVIHLYILQNMTVYKSICFITTLPV